MPSSARATRPTCLPLLPLLLSCAAPALPPAEPVAGVATAPDGLPIAYDARGRGDPALVFVHGWACDRTFWREQVGALSARHRVVTLDLGGHGESGAERTDWTIEGLAGDVTTVADALGLEDLVLIGHSLGAPVCLAAAPRLGGRVRGIVAVDALHDVEFRLPEAVARGISSQLAANYEQTLERAVRSAFPEAADPRVIQWVVGRALLAPRPAVLAIPLCYPALDLAALLHDCGVPVRAINAAPYPPGNRATETERNRAHGDFDAALIEGAGHFLMLERPEQFNRALEVALDGFTAPGGGTAPARSAR